jgi:YebC/PmpR family DNA-binding regulatory protein
MSGHSHAKTIRKQKEATDQKRGQIFSKMARLISVAVREGGSNPETNSKLRLAIETARSYNMPNDNIERAIKRGTGEVDEAKLEEVAYEAYGPGGIAMIIEGITDNKNRSLGEVKQILNQYNGKLAGEGSVRWMFEKKGCVTINTQDEALAGKNKEDLELLVIEAGAQDIFWHDEELDIYVEIEDLDKLKKGLEEKGIKIDSVSLDWKPKEMLDINEKEKESCLKLFEALDASDTVQEIYSNLKA